MSGPIGNPGGRPRLSRLVRWLLISTASAGVIGLGAAHATTTTAAGAATAAAQPEAQGGGSASSVPPVAQGGGLQDTGSIGLSEVVVTGRRRTENLQRTPISETVISGARADELNIRNFQQLRGAVPDLEIVPLANGGASITIRGIGQTSNQVNVDAKAGFYVNDGYVARQEGNALYFYDVDSLQVLKGPQGTLFGKNTTAGALLLNNVKPSAQPGGYLDVRAGNYSRLDTEGAVNLPLADNLFARLSFRTESADGFIKHVVDNGRSDDIDDKSVRGQLEWKPTSRLTVDLLGEYNKSNTDGSTAIVTGCNNNAAYVKNYNALHIVNYCSAYPILNAGNEVYGGATLSIPTSSAITDVAQGGNSNSGNVVRERGQGPFNDTEVTTGNARISYALDSNTSVKSITTYRRSSAAFYNPAQNAPNDIYAEFDNTSTTEVTQEFNLNGRALDNKINYVAGIYYYYQNTRFLQDTGPDWIDPVGYTYNASNNYQSGAAYIQGSYRIIPPLELTAGLRYTYDYKSAASDVFFQQIYTGNCSGFTKAFIAGSAACGGHLVGAAGQSWDSIDPRGQLSYQWTPDFMTYVSITSGYNAGGFNQQLGVSLGGHLVSYNPERLVSYETGVKSEWLHRKLRVNVAAFYQDFSDIQTTLLIVFNGVSTRQVQTGATAHEDGLEAEIEYQPIPDLSLRVNGDYLDQAYDSIAPGVNPLTLNLKTPVNSAPKYSYSFDATYTYHLPSAATLTPSINWRAVDRKPACNAPGGCYLPAYGLLGGRLDFRPSPGSPWTAGLYATNILDAKVELTRVSATVGSVPSAMGLNSYVPGRPREFGVEIRRVF